MKVLLAHSNMLANDAKQTAKMVPYPPLAALYAAGALRALPGVEVCLFDGTLDADLSRFEALLEGERPGVLVVMEDIYNFISKMCLKHQRETARAMCRMAKLSGAAVVVAGPDMSDAPEVYLHSGADVVMVGEPDATLVELVGRVAAGLPLGDVAVAGIAFLDEAGALARTARRENQRALDAIPFPAWDLIDAGAYRSAWRGKHGFFSVNMVASRGCTFSCNWCAKPIWGRSYAQRSAANVAEELAFVRRTVGPDHIWFCDDIFGITPKWLRAFDAEVHARDARTPYKIQTRIDLINDETAGLLKSSGCEEVWLGVESGSQKILDAMDKGTRVAEIYSARHALRRAGIRTCFFIQFGYLGESFEDILLTVHLIRELLPDDIGVSVSYPLPGTKFYDRVRSAMGAKTHWDHSHDLSVMHPATFTSPFYHHLHTTLHRDLNLRLLIESRGGVLDDVLQEEILEVNAAWIELERLVTTCRNDAAPAPSMATPA